MKRISKASSKYGPISKTSRSLTYVSKHFEVSDNEMTNLLKDLKSPHRSGKNNNVEVQICKLCDKDNKTNSDNLWKLNIFKNGGFHCFRCDCKGSWFDLKEKVKKFNRGSVSGFDSDSIKLDSVSNSDSSSGSSTGGRSRANTTVPKQKDAYSYTRELFPKDSNTRSAEAKKVLHYLMNVRGLSENVLLRYGVGMIVQDWPDDDGVWKPLTCVTFPWFQNKTERPTKTTSLEDDEDQSLANVSDEVFSYICLL